MKRAARLSTAESPNSDTQTSHFPTVDSVSVSVKWGGWGFTVGIRSDDSLRDERSNAWVREAQTHPDPGLPRTQAPALPNLRPYYLRGG